MTVFASLRVRSDRRSRCAHYQSVYQCHAGRPSTGRGLHCGGVPVLLDRPRPAKTLMPGVLGSGADQRSAPPQGVSYARRVSRRMNRRPGDLQLPGLLH